MLPLRNLNQQQRGFYCCIPHYIENENEKCKLILKHSFNRFHAVFLSICQRSKL